MHINEHESLKAKAESRKQKSESKRKAETLKYRSTDHRSTDLNPGISVVVFELRVASGKVPEPKDINDGWFRKDFVDNSI